jgi:3-oxoacyl-[acyl-carrier-protein] synthase II
MSKSILITEMGAISCLGVGFDKIAGGFQGPPSVSFVKDYEFHQFPQPLPCFPARGFDPETVLGKKGLRNKDNATKLLLGALEIGCKTAMESAEEQSRPGICIGTAFGSIQSIGDFLSDSIVNGVNNVNPQAFANTVINSPAGNANIRFMSKNLSATVATAFNAGIDAVIYACDLIERGYFEGIAAGGLEELSYYSLLGLQRSGALSPSGRIRPFATDADGCVAGEGCAVMLLETEKAATVSGRKAVAAIAGYASGFDPQAAADGRTDGEVGAQVISEALKYAGIDRSDIGFIASGANGNPVTDAIESAAICKVFTNTPVTAYKTFIGECYGASGALLIACAVSDLINGQISGNATYATPGGLPLVKKTFQKSSAFALVTSFSCEGNCSAVILKKST